MIPGDIAGNSMLHPVAKQPFFGSGEPMMEEAQVLKSVCLPPLHICLDLVDRVPARSRPKAFNRFPALSLINLGRPANVEPGILLDLQFAGDVVMDLAAAYSKLRISLKVVEAAFEILRC